MKRIKLLFVFLLVSFLGFAQNKAPLSVGEKQVNFGAGFGNGFPVYGSIDFSVHNDITIGPEIGFDLSGLDYITFAGRGDYHWNTLLEIPSEWDFYSGLNLGFLVGVNNYTGSDGLYLGMQVGGRYYWDKMWAVNLEIGGGMINYGGRFGVSRRF